MRVFGEIRGLDQQQVELLKKNEFPPFELEGGIIKVEYEGPYIDIEQAVEDIARILNENCQGYVDCIDHENWEVLRYTIHQGLVSCKKINPDNPLEAYKWQ